MHQRHRVLSAPSVPRRALGLLLLLVLACDSGGGKKDNADDNYSDSVGTWTPSIIDTGNGSGAELDSGPSYCSPCRYCAVVVAYVADSTGNFVQANEVSCRPAKCDEYGEPTCAVNEPKQFVAKFNECTRFESLCPGDQKVECMGKGAKCGHQIGLSTDCSEREFCDESSGTWQCPYGYSTGICDNF